MKAKIYDLKGKKKGETDMPEIFKAKIREDIVKKYFEIDKFTQPYASDPKGGRKHSASGIISHKRHDWKGHYGRGISRVPRKVMWRRGTQFFWIGAEISSARGGRRAHPPKGIGKEKKINLKEVRIAMESGFAATGNEKLIVARYGRLKDLKVEVPVVVESDFEKIVKTKELMKMLKEIFGEVFENGIIEKEKKIRAGKGKIRGRKYKSNAGLLFVKTRDEKFKLSGIDVKNVEDVKIGDLYPLGRLAVYTEKAVVALGGAGK
jgi:large subunit ribosomal protein L4e